MSNKREADTWFIIVLCPKFAKCLPLISTKFAATFFNWAHDYISDARTQSRLCYTNNDNVLSLPSLGMSEQKWTLKNGSLSEVTDLGRSKGTLALVIETIFTLLDIV